MTTPSAQLAAFAAGLSFDAIPEPVVRRTEDLLVDWFGSVIAGHGSRPVEALTRVVLAMGPQDGPSEVINARRGSSPYIAAMANAAASHVAEQDDVHQSKFSMGTVLGLVAQFGHAGLTEFDQHFLSPATASFRDRVVMELDAEVDNAYPVRWIGKISVHTRDGRVLEGRVDEPKGDPGNTLSRAELEAKAHRLARYSGGASESQMEAALQRLWQVAQWPRVGRLLQR